MTPELDIFKKCKEYDEPDKIKAVGLYPFFRPIEETTGSSVTVHGTKLIMIGSNNYLGLSHHPEVIEAAKSAINKYGSGCTGSRFLNGNLDLHEELESRLAKFTGKEAALVFSTGFFANQGTISCLVGRGDVIYSDQENHASIIEGTRLIGGDKIKFRHNDMDDLERILKLTRSKYQGALIIADGIFSMSGDIFNLPDAVKLAKEYNCRIFIDDAHALGVLGEKGDGTAAHFNLTNEVDIIMATFSKSFASIGGYIASDAKTVDYIKHNARPFMFSAAMPPSAVATALKCLDIVESDSTHMKNLWSNVFHIRKGFKNLGFNILNSPTPIIPILIGDDLLAFSFTQELLDHGIFATPVISPAVPKGCALIRTSYMATHKKEDLDTVLEVFKQLGTEYGIIENPETQEKLASIATTHFEKNGNVGVTTANYFNAETLLQAELR